MNQNHKLRNNLGSKLVSKLKASIIIKFNVTIRYPNWASSYDLFQIACMDETDGPFQLQN